MLTLWRAIYNLLLPLFLLLVRLFGRFNPKVKASLSGRENLFETLTQKVKQFPPHQKRIWFHVASVGEFEQARPLIAHLRTRGDWTIVVSFLSVSGYEARKHFPDADLITYLPEDTLINARRFCALVQPTVAVVVRYDFWLNHLYEAKQHGARLMLISASVQAKSSYFKPILKSFYKALFSLFDKIFTVSEQDAKALREGFALNTVEVAGDTRYDQVFARSKGREKLARLEKFYRGKRVLIGGSTWQIDESLLVEAVMRLTDVSLILVPHEIHAAHIEWLESLLNAKGFSYARISKLPENFSSEMVLIVDEIGYLAELYALASVGYVGGGFGVNVHNTLEVAVHGVPVVFGGNIHKSREAKELVEAGAAFIVTESTLLSTLKNLFENDDLRAEAGAKAAQFVQARLGATEKILKYLYET
jgi:3-deoxy-D-manno-octulosonic-acid transferase